MTQNMLKVSVVAGMAGLCLLLGACSAFRDAKRAKTDRGVVVNHALHATEGIDCTDCHELTKGQPAAIAGHDMCSICHTIPEDTAALDESVLVESCMVCHTKPDFSIVSRVAVLSDELKFDHSVHNAADVSCAVCHADPDKRALPVGRLKPLCMDCHSRPRIVFASANGSEVSKKAFHENECAVCHRVLNIDTVPTSRDGVRLAHDVPRVWEKVHGMESHADPMFCAQCHDDEDHCAVCHRVTEPADHTLAWNRKPHGIQATWDRQRCSVCHEEESCSKCHRSSQPTSHRGTFDPPQSTHCVQCHFPPENNCAICHEVIDHRSAPPTPHGSGGGSPGACALCHPGGLAGAVPHLVNMTTSCTFCHL